MPDGLISRARLAWDVLRAPRGGAAAIESRRRQRLDALVRFARARSRFYAERCAGLPSDPALDALPIVTKPEAMARFDDWVTDPGVTLAEVRRFIADPARVGERYRERYLVCRTSGVSGEPAILVLDEGAVFTYGTLEVVRLYLAWAREAGLARSTVRLARDGFRLAAVLATGSHYFGNTFAEHGRREHGLRERVRVFSVQAPISELTRALDEYRPSLVLSYATALALLAREQEEGRLHLHPLLAMSGAEPLSLADRHRIEHAFRATVRDTYAASEMGLMAQECPRGRLHLNADWTILEPVDIDCRPVAPGVEPATTLMTNLANYVQPIIRYDIGDRVTLLADPCACGSPLPAIRVEGRTGDVLLFRSGDRDVRIPPLALETFAQQTEGVRRFQVVQTSPERVVARLEPIAGADLAEVRERFRARLASYFTDHGIAAVEIDVAPEPLARDPRSGKFRPVYAERAARERTPAASGR